MKNFRRPLVALCVAISAAGCGTSRIYSAQDVASLSQIEHDKYHGLTYVRGVAMGSSMPGQFDSRQLVTSLDGKGEIVESWIDYAEGGPDSPILFFAAHDAVALPLRLEKLDRKHETRENYATEEVAVDLPSGYLHEHLHPGIDVQLEGRRGSRVVTFGDDYMKGYWSKVLIAQACVKDGTC